MEFQSPPTSLTDEEQELRRAFQKRCDFANDLRTAGDFLRLKWMELPLSIMPVEIKYHVLENDVEEARYEFESLSEYLEGMHNPGEGYSFSSYGHRHENTTQHSAVLTFGHGSVKYIVMWIEKDAEVAKTEFEPNEDTVWHSAFYGTKHNRSYVTCDCGEWEKSVPTDITARGQLEALYRQHRDAEVTHDA